MQMWGRPGDFLEEVIKAINLEKGVGMNMWGGHTGRGIVIISPLYRWRH